MNESVWKTKIIHAKDCWIWNGLLSRDGYGIYNGTGAHRASYAQYVGPIPEGYEIDHKCRVRCCVNPDHLEAVTREENERRRTAAKMHCRNGHEYTPENTYRRPGRSWRLCRICIRAKAQAWSKRKGEAKRNAS